MSILDTDTNYRRLNLNYKYNEIDYAKLIYEQGFQDKSHMPTELRLAAIYMRRNLGYKPAKLKAEF